MTEKGKYVTVWKKQPGGEWKVIEDIFNADAVPPPPAPVARVRARAARSTSKRPVPRRRR